jgi:hypothetical protein
MLAIPDDCGEISSILRSTGAGVAVMKVDDIARHLTASYRDWKQGSDGLLKRNDAQMALYSRRTQASQLAHLLDQISS